jgi:hypothetical protein
VLAHVFAVDPAARCWAYSEAADFHDQTRGRFTDYDGQTYTARTSLRDA